MDKLKNKLIDFTGYLPLFGIVIFTGLYIYSAWLYPGGSEFNLNSKSFDLVHNYWCILFNSKALNGLANPARPYAIAGMIVLWGSLLIFFFRFSEVLATNRVWKKAIRFSGTVSLIIASFLFTNLHDLVTTVASLTGLVTLTGIVLGVAKSKLKYYKFSGIIGMVLLVINNYIYYSRQFIVALPLIQKLTFLLILLWISGLTIKINRMKKSG